MSLALTQQTNLPTARSDLQAVAQTLRGEHCWTLKDPVTLRYFQLRREEYLIVQLLDGRHSLEEIIVRFERQFAPRKLRRRELYGFIAMLHREGLTVATAYDQGEHLLARRRQRRQQAWVERLMNVLAIRLPGVNPNRWLDRLLRSLQWLLPTVLLASCLAILMTMLSLATIDVASVSQRLPRFSDLAGINNLISIALALALVKSLHELGHALSCKYFGGECHSLGIMFLLFTPALYCDVSDAWMFPSRWRRMAVSAAGIAVEMVLASCAFLLWTMTQPGWFNTLLFNMVLVCSVGTLLINGNPLLRYDGYFVFADWIGAPNLREQADAKLRQWFAWWLAGVELDEPRLLAEPRWSLLVTYGLLSTAYRWVMIAGVIWLLHSVLEPHGLSVIAQSIAVIVIASQVAGPAVCAARYVGDPTNRAKVNGPRLIVRGLILVAAIALMLAVPLPRRVHAPLVVQPAGARQVYVSTAGMLEGAPKPGSEVERGQTLATLRNRRLELEIAELAGKTALQRLSLEQLKLGRHADSALADGIPVAAEALADLESQLRHKQQQQSELTLRAPQAGVVLPPKRRPNVAVSEELGDYTGSPLDDNNRGCFLNAGDLLCSISEPGRAEALVVLRESEVPLVAEGQTVRMLIDEAPGEVVRGTVVAIAKRSARELPKDLLASGEFPSERLPDGSMRPQGRYYEATVRIEGDHPQLLSGGLGQARIVVERETLGMRIYRALRGTFRWPI